MNELHEDSIGAVVARIDDPKDIGDVQAKIAESRDLNIQASSEQAVNRAQTALLRPYVASAWVLSGVLMLGAVFAALGTMQALFLRRLREFATLLMIGFRRGQVVAMLVFESTVLVFSGSLGGVALSTIIYGRRFYFDDWALIVRIPPSPTAVLYSAAMALVIVFVSLSIAVTQLARVNLLDAPRAG